MSRVANKTALITGASSGIGRGVAVALAEAGATVGVNHYPSDEERTRAAEVVAEIEAAGGEAAAFPGDVSDAASVDELVDGFEATYGTPDVLVNNAGILRRSRLDEMSVAEWDEVLDVDLRGVFLVTRRVVPGMIDRGSGSVVNVASQLGFKGAAGFTHYCAAKGGVIAFTRALAREVAPDVRVNAIAPGPVETPLLSDISEQWRREKAAELPMERAGRVEDVAPTAVFLASDESSYYTGQTLSPDGGDAMH
ncbi:SDR family NAD(P)-dependent oxidoreductase [Haloferax volcanii]|uniref:Short-chain family oxidoreductase n=3 Tax=Haloferax volcanii TaxID=2246 RepID=A0A384L6L7_HALVD|nr:3-oxoacyl-ACP reductase family protein [Haloferax volcanii]ADE01931.1 putative oxidoreductase (short-chain dehydrogenase family) [Haloferax volcanii DS2]ELY31417.1 short-chain family oxidoreductase [Haloferax volcanii DS2]MBS8120769.1 3-oxoacyl-ACP reductase FabG [Haloferax volcanii]MBS8125806.1 3-oxoacyl-ACP reductase FabG [Haloferax volcanii]MBS8129590.1 3-oxoacyl-ACP reductase FabG [Haloferax volcanii]